MQHKKEEATFWHHLKIPSNRAGSRAESQRIFFLCASAIGGERWYHNSLPVEDDDAL